MEREALVVHCPETRELKPELRIGWPLLPCLPPPNVSAAVYHTYAALCHVAHLKDFFAEHSYNIEPSPRIAAEEVEQFSTRNEIETAGAFGLSR
jgi:hypothetical protein